MRNIRLLPGLLAASLAVGTLAGCGDTNEIITTSVVPAAPSTPVPTQNDASVFGNGSLGAVTLSGDTNWVTSGTPAGGALTYKSLTIPAGATLTVPSGTIIRCTETFVCEGNLVVAPWTGPGYSGQSGYYGGYGGNGADTAVSGVSGYAASGSTEAHGLPASMAELIWSAPERGGAPGGGTKYDPNWRLYMGNEVVPNFDAPGGAGGGVVVIRAQKGISITGSLTANGGNGVGGAYYENRNDDGTVSECAFASGSGGGGGVIVLTWGPDSSLVATGRIEARGGNAGGQEQLPSPEEVDPENSYLSLLGGGGGGGGIIRLIGPGAKPVGDVAGGSTLTLPEARYTTSYAYYLSVHGGGPSGGFGGLPGRMVYNPDTGHDQGLPTAGGAGHVIATDAADPTNGPYFQQTP